MSAQLPDYFTREGCDESHHGVAWDSFPSDDPNIKVRIDAVKDKHVVFLLNCESNESVRCAPAAMLRPSVRPERSCSHPNACVVPQLFRQLNLCIFLQRFLVPNEDAELAKAKWKASHDLNTAPLPLHRLTAITLDGPSRRRWSSSIRRSVPRARNRIRTRTRSAESRR